MYRLPWQSNTLQKKHLGPVFCHQGLSNPYNVMLILNDHIKRMDLTELAAVQCVKCIPMEVVSYGRHAINVISTSYGETVTAGYQSGIALVFGPYVQYGIYVHSGKTPTSHFFEKSSCTGYEYTAIAISWQV